MLTLDNLTGCDIKRLGVFETFENFSFEYVNFAVRIEKFLFYPTSLYLANHKAVMADGHFFLEDKFDRRNTLSYRGRLDSDAVFEC